ncbi:MAG: FAD-dependent oxidoreductase [Candidatus Cloacimonadaceae bacterium]|nr:FAD-dependent oxidoreductase [Candidatus Cloacimonadaceae bacterium]
MNLRDLLSPLYVWKRAFEKPYSINTLKHGREAAPGYRGFHKNDAEKCIGCGTCAEICQNATIDMVPVSDAKDGDSGLRPRVDYGKCCWCALCVDICPTGSLTMSNAYTWVEEGLDLDVRETYCYIPGVDKKDWDDNNLGYVRPEGYELLHLDRVPMPHLNPEERANSFIELVKGYSRELAKREADRCIQCGICTATCPAHMNIPAYIKAVREDDIEAGLKFLYETNPLPGVCGRICTRRCEDVCALAHRGEAISIRWLKRYLTDCVESEKYREILSSEIVANDKKIAIIGAGAGGLSAAYYLRLMGYEVEIFEQNHAAGGMLRYGIPEYRLPYDKLDKDIDFILSLGVKIHLNTCIGRDITFDGLYSAFDSVFISTGLFEPYRIGIKGDDHVAVISGLKLLSDVTNSIPVELGKKVIVVGGGNVAMDAARTAKRLGADVTVLYRRREIDMPADREEIAEAFEEGINFVFQAVPLEIEDLSTGGIRFVYCMAKMVDHGDGKRPHPIPIEGSRETLDADTVTSAIGQGMNFQWMDGEAKANISFGKWNIEADRWGQTSDHKIFIGGDMFNRTADAVTAIADGNRSARAIDKFLSP